MFHNESRTLTCTSTGGPATHVTWKKAGRVITLNTAYSQAQRITNLINGTYQTVLSTAPAVTDINDAYSCMVENTRGLSTAITEITSEDLLLSCFRYYDMAYLFSGCYQMYMDCDGYQELNVLNSFTSYCPDFRHTKHKTTLHS